MIGWISSSKGNGEHCNYFGHLLNEVDACVAMTGCLGEENVLFTIMSSHSEGSPHFVWTKDGAVKSIDSNSIVSLIFHMASKSVMIW